MRSAVRLHSAIRVDANASWKLGIIADFIRWHSRKSCLIKFCVFCWSFWCILSWKRSLLSEERSAWSAEHVDSLRTRVTSHGVKMAASAASENSQCLSDSRVLYCSNENTTNYIANLLDTYFNKSTSFIHAMSPKRCTLVVLQSNFASTPSRSVYNLGHSPR